jgi:hypothetical protein
MTRPSGEGGRADGDEQRSAGCGEVAEFHEVSFKVRFSHALRRGNGTNYKRSSRNNRPVKDVAALHHGGAPPAAGLRGRLAVAAGVP